MSVEEENKAVIRRWFEIINKHDLSMIDEVISDNYRASEFGMELKGPEALKQAFNTGFVGFPDLNYRIDDIIAQGDKIAVRYTRTGTHIGEYHGFAPSNKWTEVTGAFFYRLAGGKIVEALGYSDRLALLQQLGVSPPGQ
jgi:steroid delta-isomerase-like uncharacterized protein